jgi:hypothetical protein
MKLSNIVAQLPQNVAVDRFRSELGAIIKTKGDSSVSRECLEQIETCMRSYIDHNFEFGAQLSFPQDTIAAGSDISDDFDLPLRLRGSSAIKRKG